LQVNSRLGGKGLFSEGGGGGPLKGGRGKKEEPRAALSFREGEDILLFEEGKNRREKRKGGHSRPFPTSPGGSPKERREGEKEGRGSFPELGPTQLRGGGSSRSLS